MRDTTSNSTRIARLVGAALIATSLAACQADELGYGPKHLREVPAQTRAEMVRLDMASDAPILMRIFKEENTFEVWKKTRDGRYALLKSYEICKWSGDLGPKFKEGDRQAPEGYYAITPGLMNPNSQYYLAFNTGFPNAYDRANGRTGSALMVHGACSSRGCYAMTDEQIQEIYALARDAFRGGQKSFQLQAYPFRLTAENMGRHWDSPHMPYWKMLKEGYDTFELTRQEPKVDVCGRRYVFNATPKGDMSPIEACPELVKPQELQVALERKAAEDEARARIVFAALQEERRVDEQRRTMIAQNLEAERLRREAEAAAPPTPALASLFGIGRDAPAPTDGGTTTAAAGAADATALLAAGSPVPRPDPRGPSASAMALAEPETLGGSMFNRLFGFGSRPAEPAPAAVPPAAAAPEVARTAPAVVLPPEATASATAAVPPVKPLLPQPVASAEDRSILQRIGNWF